MKTRLPIQSRQYGSVMVLTLWTLALLTMLVTAMAAETRLSAQLVQAQQQDLETWSALTSALHQAEMELMMETMPEPLRQDETLEDMALTPRYRFNGEELSLHYPQPAGIGVRIQDHSGKINLREIDPRRLRDLLAKRLGLRAGQQNDQLDALLAAWTDWVDLNDQATTNGAERDYYAALEPPYEPRNGRLESVGELLLIRGFAELFADVDMEAAFTVYGEDELVNLNVAGVETLRLLPGLDEESIGALLEWRAGNEFRGNGDVVRLVDADRMAQLRPWLNNRKQGNHYTIMVYRQPSRPGALVHSVWAQTVEVRGPMERPRILKVDPYRNPPLRFGESPVE